jgi:glycosyltransferase involved in cell wall biosynthesis
MSKRLSQAKNHLDQARPKNKSDGVHVVTSPDAVKSSANSKIESKSVKQIFDDATVLDAGKKEAQPKGKSTVDPDKTDSREAHYRLTGAKRDPIHGYMMDLWSFIPYYVARLCSSLRAESVEATLGSVRYHLDREYLHKSGLVPDQRLLDFGGAIHSSLLRRLVKSCEYLVNLFVLGIRLTVSPPDILHVEYLPFLERKMPFELWFLQWMRHRGIRVVYTVHNVTRQDAPNEGISLFRRAYHSADALICHSEEARRELIRRFSVAADNLWVIPHGPLFENVPQLSTFEARAKLGLPQEGSIVLCAGVISEYKGVPFLLDGWKKLKQAGTKGTLLIAGTGDQGTLSRIRNKVEAEGLSDSVLLWLRFIAVEQLPLVYQAADILVYPYKAGTTSGALLTGLNYGKAVVATTLPFFQAYLKDGKTALLVDYGSVGALASALQTFILQPDERARMADALSREASQATGWQEIARKTRECYEATLAK